MMMQTLLKNRGRRITVSLGAVRSSVRCSSVAAAPQQQSPSPPSSSSPYSRLLEPLELPGGVTLRNRVLMGSMHTGLEEPESAGLFSSGSLEDMAAFYAERAKGQVGLIVTGGIAPNDAGKGYPGAAKLSTTAESDMHRIVTQAVHEHGGKIAMQILHTGRYGYHPWAVSASALKAPINWFTPKALSSKEVHQTIDDFANCAVLAQRAGYDGVEVMGSEGYFINQFLVQRTNKRSDEWGGSYANRMRLPVEIVRRIREATGPAFVIVYRLSMLDLVEDGSSWQEIVELAQAIEAAGATIINTGIGWHEARVPTIATMVPRGAFSWVTQRMKGEVQLPLCTTNRINNPATAESILQSGAADMVSMARPFLADPHFVLKAMQNRAEEINTCIGCNQACLDHIFVKKRASCLVNPIAAHERTLLLKPVKSGKQQRIAVVGAGPAGLAFSTTAAERGHAVTLFEKDSAIGGQFNMAKIVPGKEEFYETIRYFGNKIRSSGVQLRLNTPVAATELANFDAVVIATGVLPRDVKLPVRTDKVKVLSYVDVLRGRSVVGQRVAVIGAGGIGYDVSDFLTHPVTDSHQSSAATGNTTGATDAVPLAAAVDEQLVGDFIKEWGIDKDVRKGGLKEAESAAAPRKVYLLQRKEGRLGKGLGKTTGWIHRSTLKKRQVEELSGCKYIEVNDDGLVIERKNQRQTLAVDTVVLCAGQEPLRELLQPLQQSGQRVFLIGGAQEAGELDAKRAIDQGTRLAAVVEDAESGAVFEAPVSSGHKVMKFVEGFLGNK